MSKKMNCYHIFYGGDYFSTVSQTEVEKHIGELLEDNEADQDDIIVIYGEEILFNIKQKVELSV